MAATPAAARGYYHHWHHHDHIDGGDVLAGAVILGGIAAIASAASQHNHAYDAPPPPPPVPNERQGYGYGNDAPAPGQGLDRAADVCAEAVGRGRDRVETVDSVSRDRDGWSVVGTLADGAGFMCRVGNNGQVLGVNLGNAREGAIAPPPGNGEYVAPSPRGENDGNEPPSADDRPVWRDNQAQDDGRYSTSQAPDFGEGV